MLGHSSSVPSVENTQQRNNDSIICSYCCRLSVIRLGHVSCTIHEKCTKQKPTVITVLSTSVIHHHHWILFTHGAISIKVVVVVAGAAAVAAAAVAAAAVVATATAAAVAVAVSCYSFCFISLFLFSILPFSNLGQSLVESLIIAKVTCAQLTHTSAYT